jgi:hypothetical protein
MGAAERIVEVAADLAPDDPLRRAIGEGDPLVRMERIEQGLRSGVLPVMLARQESGFWFGPHEEIASGVPTWAPPGAMLPRLGEMLGDGAIVLDLVPIDYVWFPLSEAGAYTYAHSAGLLRGETWTFVCVPSATAPCPPPFSSPFRRQLPTWRSPVRTGMKRHSARARTTPPCSFS